MSSYIFRTISVLVAACAAMVLVGSSVCYALEINVKCSQFDFKNAQWSEIPGEPGVAHTVITKGMREDNKVEIITDWDDVPEDAPDSRYTTVVVAAICGQPSSDPKARQQMWPVGTKITCGPNTPIYIKILSPSGTDCPLVAGEPKYSYVADLLKEGSKAAPVAPVKTRAEYLAEAEKLKQEINELDAGIAKDRAVISAAEQQRQVAEQQGRAAEQQRQAAERRIAELDQDISGLVHGITTAIFGDRTTIPMPANINRTNVQNNGIILQLQPQMQQQQAGQRTQAPMPNVKRSIFSFGSIKK